jgi:hypothetical protein
LPSVFGSGVINTPKPKAPQNTESSSADQAHELLDQLSPEHLNAVRGLFEGWRALGDPGTVSAIMAQTVVNGWRFEVLPDRFVAGEPMLIAGGDI